MTPALTAAYNLCLGFAFWINGIQTYPDRYPRCIEIVRVYEKPLIDKQNAEYEKRRQKDDNVYQQGVKELP